MVKLQSEPEAGDRHREPAKQHIRGSTLLLSGRMIALAINFAAQILIVRYLSKQEYGAFAFALSLVSVGATFSVLGFDKTIARFAPLYQEARDYSKLFGSIVLMVVTLIGLSAAVSLLMLGLAPWFAESFISSPLALTVLMMLIVLVPVNALDSFLVAMFATFASPRSIFLRRYILGPSLKLIAVLLVIVFHADVHQLAIGYAVAGLLGVSICLAMLIRILKQDGLLQHFRSSELRIPFREIFSYSVPLTSSDLIFLVKGSMVVVFLEWLLDSESVAEYRAVFPLARLNEVVISTFAILFAPTAARLFAQRNQVAIDKLYWQTAAWITALSFPIFATCFALAKPLTVTLFGSEYASSAPILALLALGCYFNAALGFNTNTLKIVGKVRFVVLSDLMAIALAVGANLILIPHYGALGAAIATCATQIIQNLVNQVGLLFGTGVSPFDKRCLTTYLTVTLATLVLVQIQSNWSPPLLVGLSLTAIASLVVIFVSRQRLELTNMMPELMRVPLLGRVFG